MKVHLRKTGVIVLAVLLLGSVAGNFYLANALHTQDAMGEDVEESETEEDSELCYINFPDANTRDNYDTIHNLKAAQQVSKGAGIKVGILDWGFGFDEHKDLYAGGKDFMKFEYHDENFKHVNEHGFWMAQTLKEIAPEAEVYALGTFSPDNEDEWVDSLVEAIHWAMEHDIDILTLSHQEISDKNKARLDDAVNEAVAQGIVTTFIHYDNPNNILPWGIWNDSEGYEKEADVNIFQYDYNTLIVDDYKKTAGREDFDTVYKRELCTSVSSMSVVTGGFVAILKSINNTLTPEQYKEILVKTSRPLEYEGERAPHVVDMEKAVQYLMENY